MAVIHRAELTPSKLELLAGWAPSRPWCGDIDASALDLVGAYRFDDPDGAVGLEAHLLCCPDGTLLHVPVTYRGAPLEGAEDALLGTTEHSVLGTRWVYDACFDPVWTQALARAVLAGGTGAEYGFVTDEGVHVREPTMLVAGSGVAGTPVPSVPRIDSITTRGRTSVVRAGGLQTVVVHVLGANAGAEVTGAQALTATWRDQDEPELLATVRTG